ncbi:CAP domain-containing protein [Kovacikia minuta CCNUW1]|uniref:CAP domain-containing protein n=1 Tax=Kovacikia minuta TaxID=2931930 RepID=UPI001CCC9965|nr:CAP domain-containing protein [Kovacikia minuta]UBF25690.1 CAP domain-containing protein [Kovacikia minuta CCNUW1]
MPWCAVPVQLKRDRRGVVAPGQWSIGERFPRFLPIALLLVLTGCNLIDRLPQLSPPWQTKPVARPTVKSAQSAATAGMESEVRQRINTIRQRQGLTALRYNDRLAQVARSYSRRMAEQNFFAHVSPQGDTLSDRVGAARIFYFTVGENLFTSTNIPQPTPAAVEGWMKSPGHRENILYPEFRETGVGVWKRGNTYYFTQLFMRSL